MRHVVRTQLREVAEAVRERGEGDPTVDDYAGRIEEILNKARA